MFRTSRRSRPRTLLVVRGKLGDTLAAWPSVKAYADRHPDEEVWLAVRKNYALLFKDEPGVKFLPFGSSAALIGGLVRLRLTGTIAKLGVLWGFGKQIPRLASLAGAPLQAYLDHRFGTAFNLIAPPVPNERITDASWRVARLLDHDLPRPDALHIASLAARRRAAAPSAVCVVPVADEPRRLMSQADLSDLARYAREHFPDSPVWLLGNPKDASLQPLLAAGLPEGMVLKPFPRLDDLIDSLVQCRHLLTTDTGVYHLAAAMAVPATVFFGPTQPNKIILPGQHGANPQRAPNLANDHCEVKDCTKPRCLNLAVANWCGSGRPIPLDHLPEGCLLASGVDQSVGKSCES